MCLITPASHDWSPSSLHDLVLSRVNCISLVSSFNELKEFLYTVRVTFFYEDSWQEIH